MSDRAYFVSDLHLGSMEEPHADIFHQFLKSFKNSSEISHLFLVGDIFDLWIGNYKYFRERFAPIIIELQRLVNLGVEVHYFEGNHDLYLEEFFGEALGLFVHDGPAYFKIGSFKVRVEHGDQMDPDDRGYHFLRAVLRSKIVTWLAQHLPESIVIWLGQKMSQASRKYTSQIKTISVERARKVIREHALNKLRDDDFFDVLVCGHIHVVENLEIRHTNKSFMHIVRLINLGAWFDGPRVLLISNDQPVFLDLLTEPNL